MSRCALLRETRASVPLMVEASSLWLGVWVEHRLPRAEGSRGLGRRETRASVSLMGEGEGAPSRRLGEVVVGDPKKDKRASWSRVLSMEPFRA